MGRISMEGNNKCTPDPIAQWLKLVSVACVGSLLGAGGAGFYWLSRLQTSTEVLHEKIANQSVIIERMQRASH